MLRSASKVWCSKLRGWANTMLMPWRMRRSRARTRTTRRRDWWPAPRLLSKHQHHSTNNRQPEFCGKLAAATSQMFGSSRQEMQPLLFIFWSTRQRLRYEVVSSVRARVRIPESRSGRSLFWTELPRSRSLPHAAWRHRRSELTQPVARRIHQSSLFGTPCQWQVARDTVNFCPLHVNPQQHGLPIEILGRARTILQSCSFSAGRRFCSLHSAPCRQKQAQMLTP